MRNSRRGLYVAVVLATLAVACIPAANGQTSPSPAVGSPPAIAEIDKRLVALREKLAEMQLHFVDAHPDIIRTKQIINELEQQRVVELAYAAKRAGTPATRASPESGSQPAAKASPPVGNRDPNQEVDRRIDALESKLADQRLRLGEDSAEARMTKLLIAQEKQERVIVPADPPQRPTGGASVGPTILGFEFNAPLRLPECPYKAYDDKWRAYVKPVLKPCITFWNRGRPTNDPLIDNGRDVVFPPSDRLAITRSSTVGVSLEAGLLAQIRLETVGIEDQERVMLELHQKFGPPTAKEVVPMSNKFGARVEAVRATWETGGLVVDYYGVWRGRADLGWVHISTPAFSAKQKAAERVQAIPTRPL